MRPILLEFGAFGPYKEPQSIDFNDLRNKGLFLICGDTGSGKTMMLDAMCFALYGMSSGNLRNDFKALRCTKAEKSDPTFVRFILEAGGSVYKFERRLEMKRTNLSESYILEKQVGDAWEPLFENPKKSDLNAKAEEIIGLKYDQFRQVIILPQGQFEKLLVSSSDEKEQILCTIFGVSSWKEIAERFFLAADAKKKQLNSKKEAIENSLSDEDCDSLEELKEKIDGIVAKAEEKKTELSELDLDAKAEALQKLLQLADSFAALDKALAELAGLEARLPEQEERKKQISNAERAEVVRPAYAKVQEAIAEEEKRKKALEHAESAIVSAVTAKEKAEEALAAHNAGKEAIKKKEEEVVQLEAARPAYEAINDKQKAVAEAERILSIKKKAEESALKARETTEKAVADAKKDAIEKEESAHWIRSQYLAGICGEIAANELKADMPCPVCGSMHHPNPATISEGHVTKEMMEKAEAIQKKAQLFLEELQKKQESAVKNEADAKEETNQATIRLAEAKKELEAVSSSLHEGIADLNALNQKIHQIKAEIAAYNEETEALTNIVTNSSLALEGKKTEKKSAEEEAEKATKAVTEARKKLSALLKKQSFASEEEMLNALMDPDELRKLRDKVNAFAVDLGAAKAKTIDCKEAVSGKVRPDTAECRAQQDEIKRTLKEYQESIAVSEAESERLSKKYKELKKESDAYMSQITQAEEDFAFAKALRGDNGTGLQRYVLGIMFNSVIQSANKMLELVHNGRYRLIRTDDKAVSKGHKSGLDLKVHDRLADSEEDRFVQTLSGGEKFLVSLALSIGLSNVAGKGGIRIEALFIDEGFGSLDDTSIEDAMSVLETVQRSNGMVGIISHVQLLQERIGSKLVVHKEKENGTSHITSEIG